MSGINEYVAVVNKILEQPRNELERRLIDKPNKNIQKIVDKYDQELMEKYRYIEKMLDEELEKEREINAMRKELEEESE